MTSRTTMPTLRDRIQTKIRRAADATATAAGTTRRPASPVGAELRERGALGGAGDQAGTGVASVGGAVYVSGTSDVNGSDGLVAQFDSSLTTVWSKTWPTAGGWDRFRDVAVSSEGVYTFGDSYSRTVDCMGGKETKSITVKFPLAGPPGGGYDGAIWDRQTPAYPGAFPYCGGDGLNAGTVTTESSQTVVYAAGTAQSGFWNGGRMHLNKLDVAGNTVWSRNDYADQVGNSFSGGQAVVTLNGAIYVGGRNDDGGAMRPYLRKYDAAGNSIWIRKSAGDFGFTGEYTGITAFGNAIYAVGYRSGGAGGSNDFLIEKWDETGTRLWSKQYDRGSSDDQSFGVAGSGSQLFVVGSTNGGTAGGNDAVILEIATSDGDFAFLDAVRRPPGRCRTRCRACRLLPVRGRGNSQLHKWRQRRRPERCLPAPVHPCHAHDRVQRGVGRRCGELGREPAEDPGQRYACGRRDGGHFDHQRERGRHRLQSDERHADDSGGHVQRLDRDGGGDSGRGVQRGERGRGGDPRDGDVRLHQPQRGPVGGRRQLGQHDASDAHIHDHQRRPGDADDQQCLGVRRHGVVGFHGQPVQSGGWAGQRDRLDGGRVGPDGRQRLHGQEPGADLRGRGTEQALHRVRHAGRQGGTGRVLDRLPGEPRCGRPERDPRGRSGLASQGTPAGAGVFAGNGRAERSVVRARGLLRRRGVGGANRLRSGDGRLDNEGTDADGAASNGRGRHRRQTVRCRRLLRDQTRSRSTTHRATPGAPRPRCRRPPRPKGRWSTGSFT